MTRLITKQMRDSFKVMNAKFMFAFGLCEKDYVEFLLNSNQKKQRILILKGTIK